MRGACERSPELGGGAVFISGLSARLRAGGRRAPRAAVIRRWSAVAAMLVLLAGTGFGLRAWSALGLAAVLHAAAGDHQFCALTYALAERPIPLAEAARRYDPIYAALIAVEPASPALSGGPVRVIERHACPFN